MTTSKGPTVGNAMPDAADETLAAEIIDEICNRPPIKCQITFHWSGTEDEANLVVGLITAHLALLRRRHPWLNFDSLDSIVFHRDYEQALNDVSARAGLPCQATQEVSGQGVAMVVPLEDMCIVVFHAGIAHGLLGGDASQRDLSLENVAHELCHVHDYGRMRRLLGAKFLSKKVSKIDSHVFTAAESAWSEYFANKYSTSACASPDMHPTLLAEVVPHVVQDVRDAIRAYRTQGDLNKLMLLCEKKILFLFQCVGYAAGRLTANSAALGVIAPESEVALKAANLFDVWELACSELARLDDCRDTWTSFDELQPLMKIVDITYRRLGLVYSETAEGGLYVNVPHTAETSPGWLVAVANLSSVLRGLANGK